MGYGVAASLTLAGGITVADLLASVAVLAIHMLSFDPIFDAIRASRYRRALALALVNTLPYAVAVVVGRAQLLYLAVLAAILAAILASVAWLKPSRPATYIVGSAAPALPSISVPAMLGAINTKIVVFTLLYTVYVVATAAYIETRLPHRHLDPRLPLLLWVPGILAAATLAPYTLAAMVEPTVKLIVNAARPSKIDIKRIRRLGVIEVIRLTAYTAILVAVLLIAEPSIT
jgi:hypothetical protein